MQKDAAYMKLIEEISLNAWPSHKIELYDGWLIRFSHNYTYRTNSVEQVGDSLIPIEEKIAYCEAQYRNYHTPSNFKINPLLDSSFDKLLEEKGYEIRQTTEVMTMPMTNFHIGLYAIYVDASCRRKHFARAICSSILTEAQKKGATHAYLQVVKGNTAAKNLYTSLGFEDFYTYWFRSKEV